MYIVFIVNVTFNLAFTLIIKSSFRYLLNIERTEHYACKSLTSKSTITREIFISLVPIFAASVLKLQQCLSTK